MKIRNNNKGFTIVELLIVIVVIGILAALVITTFTGIQQRARDTERTTDINAIRGHLEAYYANNGYYPEVSALTTANLEGLDGEALIAPGGTNPPSAAASTLTQYQYEPAPAACAGTTCTSYTLRAVLEESGEPPIEKTSLN